MHIDIKTNGLSPAQKRQISERMAHLKNRVSRGEVRGGESIEQAVNDILIEFGEVKWGEKES